MNVSQRTYLHCSFIPRLAVLGLFAAGMLLTSGLARAQQPAPQTQLQTKQVQQLQQLAEHLRQEGRREAARQIENQLKTGSGSGTRLRKSAPMMKAQVSSGKYKVFQQQNSFVVPQNPNQRLNLDLGGTPKYAGDVDNDGIDDYVYNKSNAGDHTTQALDDVTGKTVLFLGKSSPTTTEDQFINAQLRPVGDLDDDGHDDAIAVDIGAQTVRIYRGTASGYQDSGETLSLNSNLFRFGLDAVEVYGFTDYDGDGTEDVLVAEAYDFGEDFLTQQGSRIEILFGNTGGVSNVESTLYDVYDGNNFYVKRNVGDITGDGTGELVQTGNGGAITVFDITSQSSGDVSQIQESFVASVGEDAPFNLDARHNLLDVNGDNAQELTITWGDSLHAFPVTAADTLSRESSLLKPGTPNPVGDLDGDGSHDFYTYNGNTETRYVSYGPVDLTDPSDTLTYDTEISYPTDYVGGQALLKHGRLGDVDGDDTDDTILGYRTPSGAASYEAGRRFVLGDQGSQTISTTTVTYQRRFNDRAVSTTNVGDVNDDGVDDVATVYFDRASVGVRYGGGSLSDEPDVTLSTGEIPYVAAGGDFNGDGISDVATVSYGENSSLDIFLGSSSGLTNSPDRSISFNNETPSGYDTGFYHLANAGDLNDDGTDDLVAGAPFSQNSSGDHLNQVFVYYGSSSSLPTSADEVIDYTDSLGTGNISAGYRLAGAGDFNGDGVDDLAVGVGGKQNSNGSTGAVHLFYGGSNGLTLSGGADLTLMPSSSNIERFSRSSLRGGKDINGDGEDDLVVASSTFRDSTSGAPQETAAHAFYGGSGSGLGDAVVDEGYKIPVDANESPSNDFNNSGFANQNFGSVTLADFNQDGKAEVVINSGFQANTNALLYAGSAASAPNSGTRRSPNAVFDAPNGTTSFGSAYRAAAGDFTDDGTMDYFATQSRDDNDADWSSRMYRYTVDLSSLPPTPPTSLRVERGSQPKSVLRLTWDRVQADDLAGYNVYRSTSAFSDTSNATRVNGALVTSTDFTNSGLSEGTTYHYRVTAVDTEDISSGLSDDGQETTEGLVASASATIDQNEEVSFSGTGTNLAFEGVDNSGDVTVERYAGEPSDTSSIDETNVSDDRLVIDAESGLDFTSARVEIAVGGLDGINDPTNVTIYKRDDAGSGTFKSLTTTVGDAGTPSDISDDTLYASTDSFSEFALASDTEPLPVEFASFDAQVIKQNVRLSWTTASERNNAGFRIQRRIADASTPEGRKSGGAGPEDSASWTTVGRVDGTGTTTEAQSYHYTDSDFPYEMDQLTYRLKQVDTDGSVHYSKTITVERSLTEVQLLGTYPNPVRQQATVRYALPEKQEVTIRLYDVLGRQVRTVVSDQKEGRHKRRLDVGELSSGVYFLRLRADGQVRTQKMTIVR